MGLFYGKSIRYRAIMSEWGARRSRIFGLPHHSIDLIRAAAGAWLLAHAFAPPDPLAVGLTKYTPALIQGGVILLGVLLQTIVCREPDSLNAPFAYLVGLTVGFLPPLVAGMALVLALTVALGTRVPALFFLTLAAAVMVAGLLFIGRKSIPMVAPICASAFMPWILALLFSRELTVTHWALDDENTGSPFRDSGPA
jgi:hypothetical protein